PNQRTCIDASIPMQWCSCYQLKPIHKIHFQKFLYIGEFMIETINKLLSKLGGDKCTQLQLYEILRVYQLHFDDESKSLENEKKSEKKINKNVDDAKYFMITV